MTTRFRATFTGTSGTNAFSGYTPEVGAFDSSVTLAGAFVVELDGSGNARIQATNGVQNAGQLFLLGTGGPADFSTTLNFTPGVAGIASVAAISWRDNGAGNGYYLYCQEGGTGIVIARSDTYAPTTLGSYTTGFSAGASKQVQLIVEGTRYRAIVDGVVAIDVTDATYTATGSQTITFNDFGNTTSANKTLLSDITVEDSVPVLSPLDVSPVDAYQAALDAQWTAVLAGSYAAPLAADVVAATNFLSLVEVTPLWLWDVDPAYLGDVFAPLADDVVGGGTNVAADGQALPVGLGTVSAQATATQAVTGQALPVALGTVSAQATATQAATGQALTVALGTVSAQATATQAVTGQALPVALGSVSAQATATQAVTGQALPLGLGTTTAKATATQAATGQALTVALGTVVVLAGSGTVPVTGQALPLGLGVVLVTIPATAVLNGQAISLGLGTVTVYTAAIPEAFSRRGTTKASAVLPIPPVDYSLRDQTETRRVLQYIIEQMQQQITALEARIAALEP